MIRDVSSSSLLTHISGAEDSSLSFAIDYEGSQIYSDTQSISGPPELSVSSLLYSVDTSHPLGEPLGAQSLDPPSRACFNCGSPAHQLSTCPFPHDKAVISAAASAFRRDTPSSGFKRYHEVGENLAWRLHCLDYFAAGSIRLPELRDALGLDDPYASERERWRRLDELPWFAGDFGRGNRGMVVWGYPSGYYAVEGP